MGAASTEGYVSVFMLDTKLKALLEKGEIVHFSACDGNEIDIYYADQLNRCQINYLGDKTLKYADANAVAATGGYSINGINKKAVVITDFSLYKDGPNHDPHYDTKAFDDAWIAVKLLEQSSSNGWLFINHSLVWDVNF